MEKQTYIAPTLEIIAFDTEDVITTSVGEKDETSLLGP